MIAWQAHMYEQMRAALPVTRGLTADKVDSDSPHLQSEPIALY